MLALLPQPQAGSVWQGPEQECRDRIPGRDHGLQKDTAKHSRPLAVLSPTSSSPSASKQTVQNCGSRMPQIPPGSPGPGCPARGRSLCWCLHRPLVPDTARGALAHPGDRSGEGPPQSHPGLPQARRASREIQAGIPDGCTPTPAFRVHTKTPQPGRRTDPTPRPHISLPVSLNSVPEKWQDINKEVKSWQQL